MAAPVVCGVAGAPYEKELAAAKKAVSLASVLCQIVQNELLQSDVQCKADASPVTVADYGSQALVNVVLGMELSGPFNMVAEEDSADLRKDGARETVSRITDLVNRALSYDGGYSMVLTEEGVLAAIDDGKSGGGPTGRHWVLDPIDGTKGFMRGEQYAVALALLEEGKVVLGVLACPNLPLTDDGGSPVGSLFSARIGCGADVQPLDGSASPRKITVSGTDDPAEATLLESYEALHSMHDLSSSISKKLGIRGPSMRIDSQAKYGVLARGDGDIYLRFPHKGYKEKIWDHAAGFIIVTEAGGVVKDAAGNDLDFSGGKHLEVDMGILATNRKLMAVLLDAVREAIGEQSRQHSSGL